MSRRLAASLAVVAAISLGTGTGWSAEKTRLAAAGPSDKTDTEASAVKSTASARKHGVAPRLEVAAELGVLEAQLKLARMYANGDGVPMSPKKAFELYLSVIEDHTDVRPHHARASGVARAFVALGNYYRAGIPDAVTADAERAVRLLHYAASYYGDPEAQCDLAQMYLDGEGVQRSAHLAVSWLTNAAKKRHAKAQALLGDLLWRGTDEVPRQAMKGLALLSLARQNATDPAESRWIDALYAGAYAESQAEDRDSAADLAARWQPRMGRADAVLSPAANDASRPAAAAAEAGKTPGAKDAPGGFTNVGMDGPAPLR